MKKKSTSKSAFFNLRILIASVFCLFGIAVALFAQGRGAKQTHQTSRSGGAQDAPGTQNPTVVQMIGPVRQDQDLRNLPYVPTQGEMEDEPMMRYPHVAKGVQSSAPPSSPWLKNLLKGLFRPTPTMPPPLLTFDGESLTESGCGCQPPDSSGDVGPNHFINTVNSSFKIFDKTGNVLNGPNGTTFNAFFAPLTGTPCQNQNDGDPFVMYDQEADRWVISDFAFPSLPGSGPFYECVGVSQTGDPVAGGWFLYAIQHDPGNPTWVGDYPKMATWNSGGAPAQNAYFLTLNLFLGPVCPGPTCVFEGVRVIALDRASMLAGNSANAVGFDITPTGLGDSYSLVAAYQRAGSPPPSGRDEMLLAIDSPLNGGVALTQVKGWKFHVDFGTPANSTLGIGTDHSPNTLITVDPFIDAFSDAAGTTIVPQLGTSNKIQTLGDKIMTPVVYFNQGGTESLWANSTVCQDAACTQPTGVRWYQFDVTGGNFPASAAQQQTWTNAGDGLWRFMPSISIDDAGNTAIGYSVSSTSINPGIRYAGRLATDPPSNLGQGEATMFNGTGSQTSGPRWGDYSYTAIDPSDNMSFWHVNEYLAVNGASWRQRIGKFNFQGGGPSPTPSGTPSATPTATPSSCTWSAGPDLPNTMVRAAGVYFPANGKFYAMGGRSSDTAGSEFTNPLEYDPATNQWTTRSATYPDNHVNNMACGVLTDAGTPYIYCVGGSAVTIPDISDRVFRYDPIADVITTVNAPWPQAQGTTLPGGFTVFDNKLYILGGFDTVTNGGQAINTIWEFTPSPAAWVQKSTVLPVPLGYIPTTTIGSLIYTGGGTDITAGTLTDTTNSFVYDPVVDSISTIASIPRATGETRALNFNGKMYVLGGGRVAPNPSNEVDIYDPSSNSWTVGVPFNNPRRNFPTDTNGVDHIWLAGGYDVDGLTPLASMEIFNCPQASPTPTPTPTGTATPTGTPAPPRPTPTARPRPTPLPRP
jgi:hypothetical protein